MSQGVMTLSTHRHWGPFQFSRTIRSGVSRQGIPTVFQKPARPLETRCTRSLVVTHELCAAGLVSEVRKSAADAGPVFARDIAPKIAISTVVLIRLLLATQNYSLPHR